MSRSAPRTNESDAVSPRREPKQRRSREIVDAIVGAARLLLDEEEAAAVTTNRIAERAGVSIGSLYRYFPNREAVLAAVYDRETGAQAQELATEDWALESEPLEAALLALIDFQLDRHRRLLDREGEFYRGHHRSFSLAERIGHEEVEQRIRELLEANPGAVRIRDLHHGAFLLARGVSAILRQAVEDGPERLYDPGFRRELADLVVRYVMVQRSTI